MMRLGVAHNYWWRVEPWWRVGVGQNLKLVVDHNLWRVGEDQKLWWKEVNVWRREADHLWRQVVEEDLAWQEAHSWIPGAGRGLVWELP